MKSFTVTGFLLTPVKILNIDETEGLTKEERPVVGGEAGKHCPWDMHLPSVILQQILRAEGC